MTDPLPSDLFGSVSASDIPRCPTCSQPCQIDGFDRVRPHRVRTPPTREMPHGHAHECQGAGRPALIAAKRARG